MKIFLFAHSGGNVWEYVRLFQPVEKHDFIAVELPGNVTRYQDKIPDSFEQYIEIAYQEVIQKTEFGEKVMLFGHSFGGYLLYELAKRLYPQVQRVIISCSTPFHLYQLPPESLNYSELYNFPVQASQKIVDMFNPIIRRKIELIDAYKESYLEPKNRKVIDVASTLIYAADDLMTKGIEEWCEYFNKSKNEIIKFQGGHFYWLETEESKEKLREIIRALP